METSPFHLAHLPAVAEAIEAAAACNTLEEVQAAIDAYRSTDLAIAKRAPRARIGNLPGGLVIVAEKAEPEDIETGEPFSGESGELMREVLAKTGIDMAQVSVIYAVNWAPDGERTVNATQISVSRPFLYRQLELLQPRSALMPGRIVYESMMGRRDPITPLLGLDFSYQHGDLKLPARLVWHPAFAVRFVTQISDYVNQVNDWVVQHAHGDEMLPVHLRSLRRAA